MRGLFKFYFISPLDHLKFSLETEKANKEKKKCLIYLENPQIYSHVSIVT